ncbi:MAG: amidohydrolase, partial [Deltaproteobacteria bacterium]
MANERIISADSHVNPPKDLWASRAPARLRERAPRVESTPQGDFWIVDSQVSGAIGLDASAGHKPEEFRPAGMTYK